MEIIIWDYWALIARVVVYSSLAAVVGGFFCLYLCKRDRLLEKGLLRYAFIAAAVGVFTSMGYFFIRVGGTLEEGLAGMFEPDMVAILWDSPIGDALIWRLVGFLLAFFAITLLFITNRTALNKSSSLSVVMGGIAFLGMVLVASSFTQAGHAAEQPSAFSIVLVAHILLVAWWMGALCPLWLVCHKYKVPDAHAVLERFGRQAIVVVAVLLSCGLFMAYRLTGWDALLSSDYGSILLIKMLLVTAILILAAFHKLYLVPKLQRSRGLVTLKRSITLEGVVAIAILGVTAVLTTLVGPIH